MKVSNPNKPLNPAIEISKTDWFCTRIAPYLIILFIVILLALAAYIVAVNGANLTGTEANLYYNNLEALIWVYSTI